MTYEELSQLYALKREVEDLNRRIQEIEIRAEPGAQKLTGMPLSQGASDKVGEAGAAAGDLHTVLEEMQNRCAAERLRLESYIAGIDDSHIRLIFRLRFVDGLKWEDVARNVGGNNTEASVRMACKRWIEKHGEE